MTKQTDLLPLESPVEAETDRAPELGVVTGSDELVSRYRELAAEREIHLSEQARLDAIIREATKQRDAARRRQGDLWRKMDSLTFRMTPEEIAEAQNNEVTHD